MIRIRHAIIFSGFKQWYIKFLVLYVFLFLIYETIYLVLYFGRYLSSKCLFSHPNQELIQHKEEWEYQNSLTGQWYTWKTVHERRYTNDKWTVQWLNTSPISSLGVIVYLTTKSQLHSLKISLSQLARLLINNPRPIVIFHEGDFNDDNTQHLLANIVGSKMPLAFEHVRFADKSLSISNSYRFFTLMLPHHPLLRLFTFYWRLDSQSYLLGSQPIQDPFILMQKNQVQYAFIMTNTLEQQNITHLWPLFIQYLYKYCLEPSTAMYETQMSETSTQSLSIFFTNFAIANVSLFRDHLWIRSWLQMVDRSNGIYRYQWSDAAIHTLALTQFIERQQIAHMRYFGYLYKHDYVCASGIGSRACEQELKEFLIDDHEQYHHYEDGCSPSFDNPLCYLYRELRVS